jgi:hypothetical protein
MNVPDQRPEQSTCASPGWAGLPVRLYSLPSIPPFISRLINRLCLGFRLHNSESSFFAAAFTQITCRPGRRFRFPTSGKSEILFLNPNSRGHRRYRFYNSSYNIQVFSVFGAPRGSSISRYGRRPCRWHFTSAYTILSQRRRPSVAPTAHPKSKSLSHRRDVPARRSHWHTTDAGVLCAFLLCKSCFTIRDIDLHRPIARFPGANDLCALSWAHVRVWGAAGSCHTPPQRSISRIKHDLHRRNALCAVLLPAVLREKTFGTLIKLSWRTETDFSASAGAGIYPLLRKVRVPGDVYTLVNEYKGHGRGQPS